MKLSDQALGALMLALQKSLIEQSDIVSHLREFDFVVNGDNHSELLVANPPTFKVDDVAFTEEKN
tara:strand:+ start:512 stop:706 length:195 start_codon:yes stop_codon:yes gene_type:complete